jgi:hypothetical protein
MPDASEQAAVLALVAAAPLAWHWAGALIEEAGGARRLLAGDLRSLAWHHRADAEVLARAAGPEQISRCAELAAGLAARGTSLVTVLDDGYPADLHAAYDRPPFLFVRGVPPAPGGRRAIASGRMSEPVQVRVSPNRTVALVDIPLQGNGKDRTSIQALDTLRGDLIPATVGKLDGVRVGVTGDTAGTKDFSQRLHERLPLVFAFVLGLAFLLLLVTFRSVVVPATSILLNLLSVAASYGVLVAVFQHGWGGSGSPPIAACQWLVRAMRPRRCSGTRSR